MILRKKLDDQFSKLIFFTHIISVSFDNLKDHITAIKYYDKAIKVNPRYAPAYYSKGCAMMDIRQISRCYIML